MPNSAQAADRGSLTTQTLPRRPRGASSLRANFLKKLGVSAIALLGIMLIMPARQAKAGVSFGIGVGPAYGYVAPAPAPYYADPYDPYAYGYVDPYAVPYAPPVYSYPYVYGYYGRGGGYHRDWDDRHYDRGHEFRRGWGGGHEFRGSGGGHFGGGHRR